MHIRKHDIIPTIVATAGRFRDVRFTGQVMFVCLVLLMSWSGVKSIQTNYELQKQISTLRQQNEVASLQNQNLALENQYFETDEYLELSARQSLGLGLPGETELLVPESVALSYVPEELLQEQTQPQPAGRPGNWQAWVNFFLNRPQI